MAESSYDFLVIGTGPAGEAAAMKAAKSGKRVAAVEAFTQVGGGATHWGTIPSKALRRAIRDLATVFHSPLINRMDVAPHFDFGQLMGTTNGIVQEQTELRESFYDRNGVRLVPGRASFVDEHTVAVEGEKGAKETIRAEKIVIASGSRPYRPADVDFKHPRIFDSDTILKMSTTPRSLIIYGAGVIGCEYASMFNMMQVNVTLVNTRGSLLSFLDEEVVDAVSYHFADKNIRILHNEEYEKVEGTEDGVILHLKSGKKLRADCFLFTNGRSGNVEWLGLEKIGVKPNARGQFSVNGNLQVCLAPHGDGAAAGGQSAIVGDPKKMAHAPADGEPSCLPHIYAAGDIIGLPSLASASYDQGRFAATHAIEGSADYRLVTDIPTGIFTTPEISSIGRTEAQLTAEKIPYEVGKAHFKSLARAQIAHLNVGFLKLLFHRETLEILGVHCFGESASEIVHIGQAIMAQPAPHNTIKYFVTTTFNYPTMAEAYRVAALSGMDRVF